MKNNQDNAYDIIVIGAGLSGLYAVHRFRQLGMSVLCLEGAEGIGGVWYHNRYPGARVDVDSLDYSYYFSPELYREWRWSERFAPQAELLEYLNHVADRFQLRSHILLSTWLTRAQWHDDTQRYDLETSGGRRFSCRWLVMCTGPLSESRNPAFPGLDQFKGEWVQTSHWPHRHVQTAGRRIAVIGTGSSGVQVSSAVAAEAKHLYVFQRSPNYVVPAQNGPLDEPLWNSIRADVLAEREKLWAVLGGNHRGSGVNPAAQLSPPEQQARLETQWNRGGTNMKRVFSDQNTDKASNELVAEFVRSKIRQIVKDPVVAEKLCPYDHPLGTRRLVLDDGYYDIFNRDNVTLVDVRPAPIEGLTETSVKTANAHYEVDLVVFALGFHAFLGSIDRANIHNAAGKTPTDNWKRGPRTLLGMMTTGFPNLFLVHGPGSPSVLANLFAGGEFQLDWIADCLDYMRKHQFATIQPAEAAEDKWSAYVTELASKNLRLQVKNYMVHVNDDGSRVFMPYSGGMDRYVREAREVARENYRGFVLK